MPRIKDASVKIKKDEEKEKEKKTTVRIQKEKKSEPILLSQLHRHPRDEFIQFQEEGHIYTIHGETGTYCSATTFIHQNFGHFDADAIVDKMIKSKKTEDPTNKYYGMTKDEIKELWRLNGVDASTKGTAMHYNIEMYSNGISVIDDSPEFAYFLKFRNDFPHLIPYRTEWMVYYEEYKICGSIDMVYLNIETGLFEIYDWKRSKEIVYEAYNNATALTPCISHMPDINFSHYSLQLNTYKKILEEKYNIKVGAMYLLCIHPDNPYKTYDRCCVPHLPNEINSLFNLRL